MSISGPQRYPLPAQPTPHCVHDNVLNCTEFSSALLCIRRPEMLKLIKHCHKRKFFCQKWFKQLKCLRSVTLPSFTPRTMNTEQQGGRKVSVTCLTLDYTLSMDNAVGAGVTGVGLAIPTGSLWLTTTFLIPNIAFLTGATPERALMTQRKQTHCVTDEGERQCLYITIISVELSQCWT